MKLSVFFSLEEFTFSPTATRLGIDNTPDEKQIANLKALCDVVLDPIRLLIGKPIKVTSGFRCPQLNKIIGGAKTSQHQYGQAADIKADDMTVEELYQAIKNSKITFDQCIQEFGEWVHVSYNIPARHECLRAVKQDGRTVYTPD